MRYVLLILLLALPSSLVLAHPVLPPEPSTAQAFWNFLYQGIRHIVPLGLDHILFIVTVFLHSRSLVQIAKYSLIFTLAHSTTLLLVVLGAFVAPPEIVEPIIALSIFVLAVDLIRPFIATRVQGGIIFFFGLFHGMGFAGVLTEFGFPQGRLISSLVGFNIGVELGQLAVIVLLYFATLLTFKAEAKRVLITRALAAAIAFVSAYWFIERTFF